MIEITINGNQTVVKSTTVSDLIVELGLENKKLAVEQNKKIVPRTGYSAALLSEGDSLEIVHFIGGG